MPGRGKVIDEEKKDWLKEVGRWDQFLKQREEMKSEGVAPARARELAFDEQWEAYHAEQNGNDDERSHDPEGLTVEPGTEPSLVAPPVVSMPKASVRKRTPRATKDNLASDRRVFTKDMFKDKPPITKADEVSWVWDNLLFDDIVPEDAPSAGALALFYWCKENARGREGLYIAVLKQALPTRSEVDVRGSLKDDGKALEFVEGLRQSAEAADAEGLDLQPDGAEDDARELEVPSDDPETLSA